MTQSQLNGRSWGIFALLAYAGHQVKGRGAVVLDTLAAVIPTPQSSDGGKYITSDDLAQETWIAAGALDAALAAIGTYVPDTQIVRLERKTDGLTNVHMVEGEPGWSPRETYEHINEKGCRRQLSTAWPSACSAPTLLNRPPQLLGQSESTIRPTSSRNANRVIGTQSSQYS